MTLKVIIVSSMWSQYPHKFTYLLYFMMTFVYEGRWTVGLGYEILIYFTDYTRFTALTTFCAGLLAVIYVANVCLLSKMAASKYWRHYENAL